MKKRLIPIISFVLYHFSLLAQPGHTSAAIVIDYHMLSALKHEINKSELLHYYNIRLKVFEKGDSIYFSHQDNIMEYYNKLYQSHQKEFKKMLREKELHLRFFDGSEDLLKKGVIMGLSLEHKRLKKTMNIFIRLPSTLSARGRSNQIYVQNLKFRKGCYFYDLCEVLYDKEATVKMQTKDKLEISLRHMQRYTISLEELKNILKNSNCSDNYFALDLSGSYINMETFQRDFGVSTLVNPRENLEAHIEYLEKVDSSFMAITTQRIMNENPKYLYYPYYKKPFPMASIAIMDKEQNLMHIYFKIYKRYEDYNRNQITLKNFKFQAGIFYYDMETYQAGDCETPRFIDEFDLSNIQEYVITEEEMNQILEEHKE